jgi:hypothetical protein
MKRALMLATLTVVSLAGLSLISLRPILAEGAALGTNEVAPSHLPPTRSLRGVDPGQDFGAYSYRQAQPTHWHEIMLSR